jgi:cell division protein FtsB
MYSKSEGPIVGCFVLVAVAIAFALSTYRGNPPKQQQIDALKADVSRLKQEVRDLRESLKWVPDKEMRESASVGAEKSE